MFYKVFRGKVKNAVALYTIYRTWENIPREKLRKPLCSSIVELPYSVKPILLLIEIRGQICSQIMANSLKILVEYVVLANVANKLDISLSSLDTVPLYVMVNE